MKSLALVCYNVSKCLVCYNVCCNVSICFCCSLLDEVLERLAQGVDYHLFVAILCLLVVSDKGLTPLVLLNILSHGENSPPSPYDEKGEEFV